MADRHKKQRTSHDGPDSSPREGQDYWFPIKVFGWGWGLPVCWQGWAVLIGFIALFVLGDFYLHLRGQGLAIYLVMLTVIFVAIVIAKGEKPAGWRDGRK